MKKMKLLSGILLLAFTVFCINTQAQEKKAYIIKDGTVIFQTEISGIDSIVFATTPVTPAFVAVTDITGVPATATVGTPLTLSGTVAPATATNKTISWSVVSAGTTGATVSGATFNATAAGTATVRATVVNGASATTNYTKDFTVTVSTTTTYSISASPASPAFGSLTAGYTQPAAQTVTITNTGSGTVTLNPLPTVANYTLTALSTTSLAAGATATFTVRPNAGLAAGTYNPTITVTGSNSTSATVSPTFMVTATAVKTISVGAQSGTLTAGVAGWVEFAVTTANIPDGVYDATVANLPANVLIGLAMAPNKITVSGNSGTLILRGNGSHVAGTHTNLTLSITGQDATSAPFTLKIDAAATPAPVITKHPDNLSEAAGGTATFSITATGATSYQWEISSDNGTTWSGGPDGGRFSGMRTATLTITDVLSSYNGYRFRCEATNANGSTTSNIATLTVTAAPAKTVSVGTASGTMLVGGSGGAAHVAYTITTTGIADGEYRLDNGTMSHQNLPSGVTGTAILTISGGNGTLRLTPNGSQVAGTYNTLRLTIDGTQSAAYTLVISPTTPVITSHPANVSVTSGATATFSITATGATSYQWERSTNSGSTWANVTGAAFSGATTATLTCSDVPTAANGWQFRCVATNAAGSTNSNAATLTVTAAATAPTITMTNNSLGGAFGSGAGWISMTANITSNGGSAITARGMEIEDTFMGSPMLTKIPEGGTATGSFTMNQNNIGPQGTKLRFRAYATNAAGTGYSDWVTAYDEAAPTAPIITSQPVNITVEYDETATFNIEATNATSYQWQWASAGGSVFVPVTSLSFTGRTTPTMTYSNASPDANGMQFRCMVTNEYGSTISDAVTLTVQSVSVGTQVGTMKAGVAGSVTYTVTTTGIADGTYFATSTRQLSVVDLPTGVEISGGYLQINGSSGTLSLYGNTSTKAGTYNLLRLIIDNTMSARFTLTIN